MAATSIIRIFGFPLSHGEPTNRKRRWLADAMSLVGTQRRAIAR
jgi:hypothetical protein